ncbi:MAG: winged helix-turn-helix domain-containing protein [Acetobacteraceae bacterium]
MIVFGPFRLVAEERLLELDGAPVALGSRAFDILLTLLERSPATVGKRELMQRVWPGLTVEESTLRQHVASLRKALGAGQSGVRYVINVAGRGYRFVASVTRGAGRPAPSESKPADGVTGLPTPLTQMVGRDETEQAVAKRLLQHRFVTIVGSGGIGKTRLAISVAHAMQKSFADAVSFVDFSALHDPHLVSSAVASALGLAVSSDDPLPAILAFLRGNRRLLLFDSCEHLIDAVAAIAERIIRRAPEAHILATSREALRVTGEHMHRLLPLGYPPDDPTLPAETVFAYPAVQLFVDRALASGAVATLTDADAPILAAVCRRLDGIALAIELAAGQVEARGLRGLAALLDNRFSLLWRGRRTAPPRHQTLSATLEWSYNLLSRIERAVLRRLAIFAGSFSLDAALSVAFNDELDQTQLIEALAGLAAKSLLVVGNSAAGVRYRLLDTTRAYARQLLAEHGEEVAAARRHSVYYCTLFARAEAEALVRPKNEWLGEYAGEIDNVRSALDWAFLPAGGDVAVGIALTAAAAPLWGYLSLIHECRRRVEFALAALVAAPADTRLEMRLQAALATSLGQTGGAGADIDAAWVRTLALAETLNDIDYQLRALWGLWQIRDRGALAVAERFAAVASSPADRLTGDQMTGHSQHLQGDQIGARRHLERVIANSQAIAVSGPRMIRFHLDQQPLGALARVLWLQGFPEQAKTMIQRLVEQAKARDHAHSLCNDLALGACRIALRIGDLALAEHYIDLLLETSRRHGLTLWHAIGLAHRGILLIRQGDLPSGLACLRDVFEEHNVVPPGYRVLDFVAALAEATGRAGDAAKGLETVRAALIRAERTAEGWIMPELLRVKGELLRLQGAAGAAEFAEASFQDALHLARRQGALAWELRAATSLARLLRDRHGSTGATAVLLPVYRRFIEGFETADLRDARSLLGDTKS